MDNAEIQSFIDAYRDSLSRQRDLDFQELENNRRNAFQNIMGSANSAGMMYSNFPERAKIQYDTNTYMPGRVQAQNTYQTGLDSIRNNVTSTINSIRALREKADTLNKANDPLAKFAINDARDYAYWDDKTGTTQFRNSQGQNIRFGTAAQRAGYSAPGDIISYAATTLKGQDEINRLNDIWERAKAQGATGFSYNVGDNFTPNTINFLNDAERDFMDSLGLNLSF